MMVKIIYSYLACIFMQLLCSARLIQVKSKMVAYLMQDIL